MKKWIKTLAAIITPVSLGISALAPVTSAQAAEKVKLGLVGDDTRVWDNVKERLAKDGIELEYVKFTEYSQPNAALADGSIDLNAFQHQIFLDSYLQEHKDQELVSIGNTVNAPLGVYSKKIKDIKDLKEGDTVAIPELDASQTARALDDVTASIINSGVAVDAGYTPSKDAIYLEPVDKSSKPYVNIIVARKKDAENATYKKIVEAYQTEDTKKVIEEVSKGSLLPAWETFGTK